MLRQPIQSPKIRNESNKQNELLLHDRNERETVAYHLCFFLIHQDDGESSFLFHIRPNNSIVNRQNRQSIAWQIDSIAIATVSKSQTPSKKILNRENIKTKKKRRDRTRWWRDGSQLWSIRIDSHVKARVKKRTTRSKTHWNTLAFPWKEDDNSRSLTTRHRSTIRRWLEDERKRKSRFAIASFLIDLGFFLLVFVEIGTPSRSKSYRIKHKWIDRLIEMKEKKGKRRQRSRSFPFGNRQLPYGRRRLASCRRALVRLDFDWNRVATRRRRKD